MLPQVWLTWIAIRSAKWQLPRLIVKITPNRIRVKFKTPRWKLKISIHWGRR
jgi:hypothetical protein